MALRNAAHVPNAIASRLPAGAPLWPGQAVRGESVARLGVLQHASEASDRSKRGRETAVVIAELALDAGARAAGPIATPALARWVRHDCPWSGIAPRVPGFVPWVYSG